MPHSFINVIAQEWRALRAPALWIALAVFVAAALLSAQLPRQYVIDVGYEEGVGNVDLPFLRDFYPAETGVNGTFRWTGGNAKIDLLGFGTRPAILQFRWLPLGDAIADLAPATYQVWSHDQLIAEVPVRRTTSRQWLLAPSAADGHLRVRLVSDSFQISPDPRRLSLPLERIEIAVIPGGWAWPAVDRLLWWAGVIVLGWLILARTLAQRAGWGIAIGVGALSLAIVLDPVRMAFGAEAAFVTLALAYPLTIAVQAWLHRQALPEEVGNALAAVVAIAFATRIGGRLYPESMPGDIGFHTNRFHEMLGGLITLISNNRGVAFPYPPGPYLLLAPLRVFGLETPLLLQLGAALADSLSVVIIYFIARRVLSPRTAVLAAGIYIFTAATYLTTWWSFDTHIITQALYLLLLWGVIRAWEDWQAGQYRHEWILGLAVLSALVFLGHFGFLISSGALLGMLVAIVWVAGWRGAAWARRVRWPLTIAIGGGAAFAIIFFYSAYLPLFLAQLDTARSGGLTAVAGRGPVSREVLWRTLWQAGLIAHYGLLPVPFALAGFWLLWRWQGWQITTGLMGLSFIVAIIFAALPFITQVSNSPRYLMALSWAIAVGAAAASDALWRRGWIGRASVIGAGMVVLLNTLWYWLTPMLWRARPPEPF